MSTSPSWFDQEKFSRLVKKVGTKPGPEAATPTPSALPASAPAAPAPAAGAPGADINPAATASISLVSKPPSLLSEHRALPALPRRTTALPTLKSLFSYPSPASKPPVESTPAPAPEAVDEPLVDEKAVVQEEADEKPGSEPAELPPVRDVPVTEDNVEVKESVVEAKEALTEDKELAITSTEKPDVEVKKEEPAAPEPEAKIPASIPVESTHHDEEDDYHHADEDDDLAGIWQKMALLNEELAHTVQERDHAIGDVNLLREQLRQADEALENGKHSFAPMDELTRLGKERDAAVAELKNLREHTPPPIPSSPPNLAKAPDVNLTKTKEINFLTQERDQARKEYAELRKQFETVKREQTAPKEESSKFRKELEQQVEGFRLKLEERNREIATLKAGVPASSATPAPPPPLPAATGDTAKLKEEIASLRDQLAKAKDDTSIAQRGLSLSQKALQETRDTLREATEGTSLTRHNFDNLKNELTGLQQQNTVLQAQNEQMARDLAAAKAKISSR